MTRLTPQEQMAKLPKWAQIELEKLNRNVASLQEELDSLMGAETSILTNPYFDTINEKGRYLPNRTTVRYFTPHGRFDVSIGSDGLVIYGDNPLSVFPRASNVVNIKGDRT